MFLINWGNVTAVTLVVILLISLLVYIIYTHRKGDKLTSCSCSSKGKAMIKYYRHQKKKELIKKHKKDNCCIKKGSL